MVFYNITGKLSRNFMAESQAELNTMSDDDVSDLDANSSDDSYSSDEEFVSDDDDEDSENESAEVPASLALIFAARPRLIPAPLLVPTDAPASVPTDAPAPMMERAFVRMSEQAIAKLLKPLSLSEIVREKMIELKHTHQHTIGDSSIMTTSELETVCLEILSSASNAFARIADGMSETDPTILPFFFRLGEQFVQSFITDSKGSLVLWNRWFNRLSVTDIQVAPPTDPVGGAGASSSGEPTQLVSVPDPEQMIFVDEVYKLLKNLSDNRGNKHAIEKTTIYLIKLKYFKFFEFEKIPRYIVGVDCTKKFVDGLAEDFAEYINACTVCSHA